MSTRKPSARAIEQHLASALDNTTANISNAHSEIGTHGQASQIATLPPLTAAYVAVACFRQRLAIGDGSSALGFTGTLRMLITSAHAEKLESPDVIPTRTPVSEAAAALLRRIQNITTDDFSRGGEKTEREALRDALVAAGYAEFVQ